MNVVRTNAYAKLNLTLDMTGIENGYHMLDTLVTTVDLFDRIVVKKRKDALCRIVMHGGPFIPPEENNALAAAEAFVKAFGTNGADIAVYKNIPVGAGMGGSSADAAGVLRALGELYGVQDERAIKALADRFGSDTGYLLTGGFARLTGRGERVERLNCSEKLHILALVPREGVSTPQCFAAYDEAGEAFAYAKSGKRAAARQRARRRAIFFQHALQGGVFDRSRRARRAHRSQMLFPLGGGHDGFGQRLLCAFREQRALRMGEKPLYGRLPRVRAAKRLK